MILHEFEKRFTRLLTLDRVVLDTSKVLLFIKSVETLDREKVGLLLETDEGLTIDWAIVKGVCSRFNKQREWNDAGALTAGPNAKKKMEEVLTRSEENRRWLESGAVPTNVVEGPPDSAALEELTKMVRDL